MPKCFKNNQRIAFVLFFSIFFSSFVHPQDLTKAEFISLTTADGLSNGAIQSIFEDSKGFIWFGTYNGANKYNGYEITNYLSNRKDITSLSDGWVNSILEDRVGRLWFGTNSGLNLYNYDHDNFIRVSLIDQNDNIITPKKSNILIDKLNFLWIVSDTLLYQVLLPERNTLVKNLKITRLFTSKDVFGQHGTGFDYITLDSTNNVWVLSSKNYISLFNRKDNNFETFKIPFPDNNISNSSSYKFFVYDQYNNSLVISTSNYGLIVYSISTKSFEFFNSNNTKGHL